MSRRTLQGAGLSFFSFQDIVMGVVGVVLFIVLTLGLEQASTISASPSEEETAPAGETPLVALRKKAYELEQRLRFDLAPYDARWQALVAERARWEAKATAAAAKARATHDPLGEAKKRLAVLRAREAETREAAARKSLEAVRRSQKKHEEDLVAARTTLAASQAEAKRLEAEARISRVRYVRDPSNGLLPVIFECRGTSVQVAPIDGSWKVRAKQSPEHDELVSFVKSELAKLKDSKHYALFLFAPDSAGYFGEVRVAARASGVRWGFDPLPNGRVVVREKGRKK